MKKQTKHILSRSFQFSLFVFLLVFLFSCFSGNEREEYYDDHGNLIVKEWYNKNSLKSSITYLDESMKSYVFVFYHTDGRLKDSARYINDTIEGRRKFYESSSGLTHYENYKRGLLNGVHKAEFTSGVKSFEGFRRDNLMVGEWKFHFPNGNPITYEYYDSVGKLLCFRKYDDNGNVLKANGAELINVYSTYNQVKVNEIYSGYFEAAIPPYSELNLTVEEIGFHNVLFSTVIIEPITEWEIVFNNPGEKKLMFKLFVKEIKSGESQEYSFEENITVLTE